MNTKTVDMIQLTTWPRLRLVEVCLEIWYHNGCMFWFFLCAFRTALLIVNERFLSDLCFSFRL